MPAPYPKELRARVVQARKNGVGGPKVLSEIFNVGTATIFRWTREERLTGSVEAKPMGGGKPKIGPDEYDKLRELVEQKNDATLAEICEAWAQNGGTPVAESTMFNTLERAGFSYKKKR